SWIKVSSYVRGCHYDVIGLEPNKKYSFRVSAENQYGVGSPLTSEKPIIAKFPFDVPSPPGTPQITDSDETSVNLIWERPKSDGGSKIHGYQVEFRDPRDGRWKPVSDQLVKDTTMRVPNLMENTEYEFRVKAKNAAGFSVPSKPTASFKVKTKSSVPSPPLNVRVSKVGRSYVDVKWDKPRTDGGSKIT
ncbi:Twitchin, partial [Araneus ventricosus]